MTILRSIAAWWRNMSITARIYVIGLPVSAAVMQFPWLTAWLPDDLKKKLGETSYWFWSLALATIAPWLRQHLSGQDANTKRIADLEARLAALDDPTPPRIIDNTWGTTPNPQQTEPPK